MLAKLQYQRRGDWDIGDPIWSIAFENEDGDGCLNVNVSTVVVIVPAGRDYSSIMICLALLSDTTNSG